ncbi:peptidase M1 membrane alanine aminopeptidase [Fibrisoma limi BUZ 3]|uniref:Peptidase M1 membrane alanine aminopeptidase n=1 Tax=Fibrisoma limi BUZ 3 TaxID=1185876 RepID=I2GH08_9BACT|nr:carboxypeptidase-like regulatory domain-containing protein [Fibrisoma limi]CCH53183.1 peptidase M1 membrane alanine aminopeptidase [Fibrisoma limi BUZ 3]
MRVLFKNSTQMRPTAPLISTLLVGILFSFFSAGAFAQSGYLTLAGKVVSQNKGTPIPLANIAVMGRGIGTVTNAQGGFSLNVPTAYATDSLQVSCVGYQSTRLALSAVKDQMVIIRLQSAAVTLAEVQVQARRKTAADIIREAVAAIPRNYDTTSVLLTALYREDQEFDGKPVVSNEAVLSFYKSPYNQPKPNDQLKLISGRKKEYDRSRHNLPPFVNLSNGANSSLYGDLVKLPNDKNNLINTRNIRYYDLSLSVLAGNRPMYVITFNPGKRKRKAYVKGKLYIDAQSLAFVRTEWQITQAGLDKENNRSWVLKKMASIIHKLDLKFSDFTETATYTPYGDRWHLSHVQRRYTCTINSPSRNLTDKLWKIATSFTVTKVGPKGVQPFTEGNIAQNPNPMSVLIGEKFKTNTSAGDTLRWSAPLDSILQPTNHPLSARTDSIKVRVSNRQNGFTRADTLRGKLTPLRSRYDVTFYDLAVKVDIANKAISGSNKMRFRVLAPLDKLQLDLYANMQIHQILYAGKPLAYTREFDAVFVQFPEILKAGSQQELEIEYAGKPQIADRSLPIMGGFLWDKDRDGNPWVQVVCQGSGASLWWPNKDHLSDEPDSMRISVTVPGDLMTISNGRLLRKTTLPDNWMRYDWYVSYPINNYNVTLNIGRYAHRREIYGTDSLTLDYYYMPYNGETFRWVFDGVKPMLTTLEKQYGKYPFPRDGFTLMESLHPMEHQSAVSFGKLPTARADSLTLVDTLRIRQLVWHEASHEWWGNNVSCRDMADMWIHEAFATYSEGFYLQAAMGEDGEMGYIASLPSQVIGKEPIIGVRDVNHIHYNIGDMYAKASLVVYTFRHALNNDTLWASILKGIQQRFRYQTVSTDDIVNYINERTGTDYTPFFNQYLNHTSIPTLEVKMAEKGQSLVLSYRWKADVPNFRMPIQVTKAPDTYEFITPTTDWQMITFPNMTADDFEVDETRFYVKVEEVEPLPGKE